MLMTEPAALTEEELVDAVGELINMIGGNIKTELFQKTPLFDISIPSVYLGEDLQRRTVSNDLCFLVPFSYGGEEFSVEFLMITRRRAARACSRRCWPPGPESCLVAWLCSTAAGHRLLRVSRDKAADPRLHYQRRQRVLDALGEGLLLLPTAPLALRNGDVHHEFRPGSDFHYLTGFPEPEALLAAWRTKDGKHRTVLFVRPRDKEREIWDGHRSGTEGALREFGVDQAHSWGELWQTLPALVAAHERLFVRLGANSRFDQKLMELFANNAMKHRKAQAPMHPILQDPTPAIAACRLRKDAAEVALMRRAAAITAAGHCAAMRFAATGRYEYEVQAQRVDVSRAG